MTMQNDVVSLVNISRQKWAPRQRSYFGALTVRTPGEGDEYAITPICGCIDHMDLGDKRLIDVKISAREIADDLARELNGDSGEGSFHGVFVAAGLEPTPDELMEAHAKLEAFHRRPVEMADLEWERSHNPMFITDLERRAVRELKLEKPWLYDAKPLAECPACGEKITSGVAVCKTCGAILDREKAAKYGLVERVSNATVVGIVASPNGASENGYLVTITTTVEHGLSVGQTVTVAGVGVGAYNGTCFVVSVLSLTQFTYIAGTSGLANSGGGTIASLTATIQTTTAHGFFAGQLVTVSGVGVSGYNGTFAVTSVPDATHFAYTAASSWLAGAKWFAIGAAVGAAAAKLAH